jgi:FtsP/CotA-like multicopper oxidase with cupredoxin domain
MHSVAVRPKRSLSRLLWGTWLLVIGLIPPFPATAQDQPNELVQPPVCSAATAGQPALQGICTVKPRDKGGNEVKIYMTAKTSEVEVGGYKIVTENYNGSYLTPVVEAMPGDTVAAHLVNALAPKPDGGGSLPAHGAMMHGGVGENPTNLHYFHGGIVSPKNSPPTPTELGNGDNIYVYLSNDAAHNSFDFEVDIPGKDQLDARVLEKTGSIAHPLGLNWYHSHLHSISAAQVTGGLSGLLSIGDATANVKAACLKDANNKDKCLNDVDKQTDDLRARTKAHYALLRDIRLEQIGKRPEEADGTPAVWARLKQDFPPDTKCGAWKPDGSALDNDDPKLRKGYCQPDANSAWLFTLNGQRFPTVTVEGGKNLLLRLGNLSANVAYWLELYNEADGKILPLTILTLDGVVPASPATEEQAKTPVEAFQVSDVLLMPASRVEIYVRNDERIHAREVYTLKTKGIPNTGQDQWPEIQLARIVLEPNGAASPIVVALNAPILKIPSAFLADEILKAKPELPLGCTRDLDPDSGEFRRVIFMKDGKTSDRRKTDWSVRTEIVRPDPSGLKDHSEYDAVKPADPNEITVVEAPFEEYEQNGRIDWTKGHVCVMLDNNGSHKQLWVLSNATPMLHNFHIHQMKFRLATAAELTKHHIQPPDPWYVCVEPSCKQNDYKFKLYDARPSGEAKLPADPEWHDTMPVPPNSAVFIIMSFDAKEQIGRYVFHCHILKHEDSGLMAPIEVWAPTGKLFQ